MNTDLTEIFKRQVTLNISFYQIDLLLTAVVVLDLFYQSTI